MQRRLAWPLPGKIREVYTVKQTTNNKQRTTSNKQIIKQTKKKTNQQTNERTNKQHPPHHIPTTNNEQSPAVASVVFVCIYRPHIPTTNNAQPATNKYTNKQKRKQTNKQQSNNKRSVSCLCCF